MTENCALSIPGLAVVSTGPGVAHRASGLWVRLLPRRALPPLAAVRAVPCPTLSCDRLRKGHRRLKQDGVARWSPLGCTRSPGPGGAASTQCPRGCAPRAAPGQRAHAPLLASWDPCARPLPPAPSAGQFCPLVSILPSVGQTCCRPRMVAHRRLSRW